MKIRKGYILRSILGQHIAMSDGSNDAIIDEQIVLNESSAFLWKLLMEPKTKDDLVNGLLDEYDTTKETAEEAVNIFIKSLSNLNILEGTYQ